MAELAPVHGGISDAELTAAGFSTADVLDFSVNVNPYGPAPSVVAAVRQASLSRYPDPTARSARAALAVHFDIGIERVMVANGAVELLWGIARTFVASGQTALIIEPTFSEFRRALGSVGARVQEWRTGADFVIALNDVIRATRESEARCVYLCTPGNPTGVYVGKRGLELLAQAIQPALLVVDQSFLSLTWFWHEAWARLPNNVVVVRSLTKDHALAGLRVGYLVAEPSLVSALEANRPPWATSSLAEAAIVAACAEPDYVAECRARMFEDGERLRRQLRGLGLWVRDSVAPYFLVQVGNATQLRARLFERHAILVRDCSSFGLPEYIRICARPPEACARLSSALREEL